MAEYHFPVPGSEREKEIVIFARRHWASFLGQFILSFLLLLIPIIILLIIYIVSGGFGVFHGVLNNFLVLILSAYYLVVITFIFVAWLSFYYNCYIITRLEIIEIIQIGFFGRKISQLSMLRVQDVTSSIEGLLPTYFSYGDVLIETASEQKEPFVLCSVPDPQEISSRVMDLHDEVIEREGRHREILEGEGTLLPGLHTPPAVHTEKSQYQELLEKEKRETEIKPSEKLEEKESEGEISKDDLDHGGEIDIK